jgi:hypothetical protein
MNQIDYSDINKFLTSIGLIIIGVAFLIPWFINQNLNLLLIEKETLEKTTEAAKTILTKQQSYLLTISNHLQCILLLILLVGITFIWVGLSRWNKRQVVINGIQDEDWKARKAQNISKDEKREQIENTEELLVTPPAEKEYAVKKYIEIEERIYLKLSNYYTTNYITQHNIRIGQFEYDIILKSKFIQKRVDLILEIKYFKNKVSQERFMNLTRQFLMAITNYEQTQLRYGVIPILLLVFDSETTMQEADTYRLKMFELAQSNGINKLRILYRLESNIESIIPNRLLED